MVRMVNCLTTVKYLDRIHKTCLRKSLNQAKNVPYLEIMVEPRQNPFWEMATLHLKGFMLFKKIHASNIYTCLSKKNICFVVRNWLKPGCAYIFTAMLGMNHHSSTSKKPFETETGYWLIELFWPSESCRLPCYKQVFGNL